MPTDRERMRLDGDGRANDRWIGAELVLPCVVADTPSQAQHDGRSSVSLKTLPAYAPTPSVEK